MLGFTLVGTNDIEKAAAFYDALLGEIGAKRATDIGRIIVWSAGGAGLGIAQPFNKEEATAGNGSMAAIAMESKEKVERMHKRAVELGGTCEGEPGERIPGFYAAYFRDLDGNKITFFHMDEK